MDAAWTFAKVATVDFFVVGTLATGAIWIFGGSYPGGLARLTIWSTLTYLFIFGMASVFGSWLAWRLRLAKSLRTITSGVFWFAAIPIICAGPILTLQLSDSSGLWIFWVWATVGSYIFGFLLLNTKRVKNAG